MKNFKNWVLLILAVSVLFPFQSFAGEKLPQILHKAFLPLPDSRLMIYGKVLLMEADRVDEPIVDDQFRVFLRRRAKNLKLNITVKSSVVETKTNVVGDFAAVIPATVVSQMDSEESIFFTCPQYPDFKAVATFSFPMKPEYLVISDVDESVLVTDSNKIFKSVVNSLFKPIHKRKPVAGTPELYRELIKGVNGINSLLVFLSGSPVYLAPRIEKFFADKKFPEHALILQNVGPRELLQNHFLKSNRTQELSSKTMEYKLIQLGKLFKWFPNTPVIMLGDSVAHDPEIYQKLAELFPERIRLVVIRNITNQPFSHSRYDGLKKVAKLIVWNDPAILRESLFQEGLISTGTAPIPGNADQSSQSSTSNQANQNHQPKN